MPGRAIPMRISGGKQRAHTPPPAAAETGCGGIVWGGLMHGLFLPEIVPHLRQIPCYSEGELHTSGSEVAGFNRRDCSGIKGGRDMFSHRYVFVMRGLSAAMVCIAGTFSVHGAAHGAVVDFYGAPDTGATPIEVHFHYFGDDAVIKTVRAWQYTVSLTVTLADGKKHTETKKEYITVTSGPSPEGPAESAPKEHADPETQPAEAAAREEGKDDGVDVVFIHHSCGENWLNSGLHEALLAKDYIDERNDITYGVDVEPDAGRPDSLGPVPGDLTDMHHWILWFNDYLKSVQTHGCADGANRIVVFKSCFPNSHVEAGGAEAGDPFSDWKTLANYKAVYRHPGGTGQTYEHEGRIYHPLADVFARHPDTLFIAVTAPPECWQETNNQIAECPSL